MFWPFLLTYCLCPTQQPSQSFQAEFKCNLFQEAFTDCPRQSELLPSSHWAPTCSLVGFSDLPGRGGKDRQVMPAWINALRNDWVSESCPDHLAGSFDFSHSDEAPGRAAECSRDSWLCWLFHCPEPENSLGTPSRMAQLSLRRPGPRATTHGAHSASTCSLQRQKQTPLGLLSDGLCGCNFLRLILNFTEPQSSHLLEMEVLSTPSSQIVED